MVGALRQFAVAVPLALTGAAPFAAEPTGTGLAFCSGVDGWLLVADFERGVQVAESADDGRTSRFRAPPSTALCPPGMSRRPLPEDLVVQYEGGTALQRSARTMPESPAEGNHVLRFELKSPNVPGRDGRSAKGRVQLNAYGMPPAQVVVMRVRLRLSESFRALQAMDRRFDWLTISEWWNNPSWGGASYPFRVTLNVVKPDPASGADLRLAAHAQAYDARSGQWSRPEWLALGAGYRLPVNEWITLESRLVQGDARQGRYRVDVVDSGGRRERVLDVVGATHHPANPRPGGYTHFNPVKLYTSGFLIGRAVGVSGALAIDWDGLAVVGCVAEAERQAADHAQTDSCALPR